MKVQAGKQLFDSFRPRFSEQPTEVIRRRNSSEPDGGERYTTAYRVLSQIVVNGIDIISPGSWYPQDQDWILDDEEFYGHYRVELPRTLDDTDRLKLLRAQLNAALSERVRCFYCYQEAEEDLKQSRTRVTELLVQYRNAGGLL
jgi:hypothetical protein